MIDLQYSKKADIFINIYPVETELHPIKAYDGMFTPQESPEILLIFILIVLFLAILPNSLSFLNVKAHKLFKIFLCSSNWFSVGRSS